MCLKESAPFTKVQPSGLKKFSLKEVKMHNTEKDAWLVNSGKVYDVSGWVGHPGGRVVFSHAGEDCSDIFTAFHPNSAYNVMANFLIGELDESSTGQVRSRHKELHVAYREVRQELMDRGLFNGSKLYFLYKLLSQIFTALAGYYLFSWAEGGVLAHLLGGLCFAIFWQQGGWLAHDFGHNHVFQNRKLNDIGGVFAGNFCIGFSRAWWDDKHQYHHAVPNTTAVPERANVVARKGDPDIDTMPLIAWTPEQAKTATTNAFHTWMVKHQSELYIPFLLLGRLTWVMQSFTYAFGYNVMWGNVRYDNVYTPNYKGPLMLAEKIGLLLHYWWNYMVFKTLGPVEGPLIFLFSQTLSGFFLAAVFTLGHNGMPVYPSEKDYPDFWTLQVSTTRNIYPSPFVNWFCGGLQHQVEHHLFPTLPRHNLGEAYKLVKEMCKRQNVYYHEASMLEGSKEVFRYLKHVSLEFLE